MAEYEGYLILHGTGRIADPFYFELENGVLRYFTKKNGKWIGQYAFTRHRVISRPVQRGKTPNSFMIDLCPVRSVHDTERSMEGFKRNIVVLSASSKESQMKWIRAIQTWRRTNWKDSTVIATYDDDYRALKSIMKQYTLVAQITKNMDLMTLNIKDSNPQYDNSIDGK